MSRVDSIRKIDELLEIQNKYVPVLQISKDGVLNALEPISSGEVRTQQNTYEVVEQCETLIKNTINYLAVNDISFDRVVISSIMGAFCRLDYFNQLKEYYLGNDKKDEELRDLMKVFHIKTFSEIVPVNFSLNITLTGSEKFNMDNLKDLSLGSVSGIVNWEKFVNEMNLLGYNIDFLNYGKGLSFFDYIMAVKQNGFNAQVNITATADKVKKYTLRKM